MDHDSYARDNRSDGDANRADDLDRIRGEIDETKARISRELDEIGERLNPQHVKEQIKDNIREATIGRVEDMAKGAADRVNNARRGIMETVRENPVPAAIAAFGIGWLYMNGRKQHSGGGNGRYQSFERGYGAQSAYSPSESGYSAHDPRAGLADEGRGTIDKVKDAASSVGENLKDKVGDVAEGAQHAAGRMADVNRQQMRRLEDLFYENPVALGAATLAVGLAVGLAAPRTHAEVKLVGDVRDQVVDKVSETATETADKAQHVVQRAFDKQGDSADLPQGTAG